jgi:hypothetical protein
MNCKHWMHFAEHPNTLETKNRTQEAFTTIALNRARIGQFHMLLRYLNSLACN